MHGEKEQPMGGSDLTKLSLDDLIERALERGLLEGWLCESGHVHLRVGMIEVTLTKTNALAYLRTLIRRHDLAHFQNGGE